MSSSPTAKKMDTKARIADAAIRVFTRKGYDGTKTRDIADEAGINVATLHYHHKSKDELFSLVAKSAMAEFVTIYHEVFREENSLEEMVYGFVDGFTDLFIRKPHVATFCLVESERNPDAFKEIVDFKHAAMVLTGKLVELSEAGKARSISAAGFTSALVGMTIYPFITKGSVLYAGAYDEAQFLAFVEEQRRVIPEMILGYLFQSSFGK
jgi:AcrR family transcriptional regulator